MAGKVKALFSKTKLDDVDSLVLPNPPTGKEMLEDIENCSRNDSAIKFGEILQERVKALNADGNIAMDLSQTQYRNHPSSPSAETDSDSDELPLWDSLDVQCLTVLRKMCSEKASTNPGTGAPPKEPPAVPEKPDTVVTTLKLLSNEFEKVHDLAAILEPRLRALQSEAQKLKNNFAEPDDLDNR